MSDIPFSRPVRVETLPRDGLVQQIEASTQERAALAALNRLPGIERLAASFQIRKWSKGVRVDGRLTGRLTQTCVVSLEPFEVDLDESIDVKFLPPDPHAPPAPAEERGLGDEDAPDPLIDGMVDLGALASEFLTLSLDPYPRKPGVEYESPELGRERESPFSGLHTLTDSDEPD